MVLGQVFSPKAINVRLESEEKEEVFEELVEQFVSAGHPNIDRQNIIQAILDRESKMSTGIMKGIAIPHGRTDAISGVYGIIGISRRGIDYDSLDNTPVHVFFLILSSSDASQLHLRVLKRLAQLLGDPTFYESILAQKDSEGVYDVICKYEEQLNSGM